MLSRSIQSIDKESPFQKSAKYRPNHTTHHGEPDSRLLLEVPSETLTGITSYLDPPSLFALASIHSRLNEHIKNDNTWHRAFVCQFLGVRPENEIQDNTRSFMLGRSEKTWKSEFILRYRLKQRWKRSRNSTVAHIPINSKISSMHLMPDHSLLASSIQHGIVSRSMPITGKVLTGHIDASGDIIVMGVGNSNAEFTSNVTACALTSDGGTAKMLWGFGHGEVAVTTVPQAMDRARRPVTEHARCNVIEEHEGAVLDVGWDDIAGTVVASAGADGRVKLWDANTLRCLWTSVPNARAGVPDAYIKVRCLASQGFVVAVTRSGEIVLWKGFYMLPMCNFSDACVVEVRVARPSVPEDDEKEAHEIFALYTDLYASAPTFLVAYQNSPYFYRVRVEDSSSVEIITFGNASFGSISAIYPCFSGESSFVLAGDHIGCVSVYNWRPEHSTHPVPCIRKFEAHEDGASVSAFAWNGVTLITGSARGTTHVWDALTFEYLRSFASPQPRIHGGRNALEISRSSESEPVRQILIGPEKEVLLVSVGNRVMAWRAGPPPRQGLGGGLRGRHSSGPIEKKKKHLLPKYYQQVELRETISESRLLLKQESERIRKARGKEREYQEKLNSMGLNEAEALEYVLMLSRDEAVQQVGERASHNDRYQVGLEEGVFEGDFEVPSSPSIDIRNSYSEMYTLAPSSSSVPRTPERKGLPIPQMHSSNSNRKEQLSPLFHLEPTEAGFDSGSSSSSLSRLSVTPDEFHFPVMAKASTSATGGGPSTLTGSQSSWSTPLSWSRRQSGGSPSSVTAARLNEPKGGDGDSMNEELELAVKLSLAEARSRGEDV